MTNLHEQKLSLPSMVFPLVLQVLGLILTALVLDGGTMLRSFISGMLVYWIFFLMKMLPGSRIGLIDRFLLRYGILLFFPAIYVLAPFPR